MSPDAEKIAILNDLCRKAGPARARWMLTRGVRTLSSADLTQGIEAVMSFDAFTRRNDPNGERNYGAVTVGGRELHWKIDYYDLAIRYGSEDPADAAVTRRILTLMLAEED